jgi:hypothetical protein
VKKILSLVIGILLAGFVLGVMVEQRATVEVLPGEVYLFSPIQGAVYNDRMVPINLSFSDVAEYFKYSDNGRSPRTLCRNCDSYGYYHFKRKPFRDGDHELEIIGVFENGDRSIFKNFTVDTLEPKISKVSPSRGFANGYFTVVFKEANPSNVFLNYGNSLVGWRTAEVDLETCEEKRSRLMCGVNVVLDDYDLGEIEYWFNVSDVLGRHDESRHYDLEVDVSHPVKRCLGLEFLMRLEIIFLRTWGLYFEHTNF